MLTIHRFLQRILRGEDRGERESQKEKETEMGRKKKELCSLFSRNDVQRAKCFTPVDHGGKRECKLFIWGTAGGGEERQNCVDEVV